ncbi:hypothetical protein XENOCAPTIV_001788, partial [Xenoophorus captivus]
DQTRTETDHVPRLRMQQRYWFRYSFWMPWCFCILGHVGIALLIQVVSLHHSQVHGRSWFWNSSLALGGVAFGPVGADAHLLHVGVLRRATGHVDRVRKACRQS